VIAPVAGFILRRLFVAFLFALVVASAALVLGRLAPGDATSDMVLSGATADMIAAEKHRLGLDQSVGMQLASWMAGLVQFDLGQSSLFGMPVAGLVADGMRNTAVLAGLALLIATAIGLPLGVYTGTRPRSVIARIVTVLSVALVCCPPIIGTLALLFLGASTGWLSVNPGHLVLPTLALALPLAAMLERLQSQAAAEAFAAPDIVAAAARGVPVRRLIWIHAAKPALRPVLGVAGIVVATLFSGSIAVESITAWPGLGQLTLKALLSRDLYLVAGCALAGASLVAVGNLMADILRATADPRVGHAS
jgi:peptide/nickel transport system permease protein